MHVLAGRRAEDVPRSEVELGAPDETESLVETDRVRQQGDRVDPQRRRSDLARPLEAALDEHSPDAASARGRVDDEGAEARPARRQVAPALEGDVPVEGDGPDELVAQGRDIRLRDPESLPDVLEVGEVVVQDPVVRRSAVYRKAGLEERGDPIELVLSGEANRDARRGGGGGRGGPPPPPGGGPAGAPPPPHLERRRAMPEVAPTLRIVERAVGGVTILDMAGRLVLDQGDAAFRDCITELLARGKKQIILNLRDVTYIDSAGVGMMVAKLLSLRRAGGDMKLLHLTARSNRVMTITKLLTVFEAFDNEEEAVRSFNPTV